MFEHTKNLTLKMLKESLSVSASTLLTESENNVRQFFFEAAPSIKPSHAGRLHRALGIPAGKKIPYSKLLAAKKSKNPHMRAMANFALSSKKWIHGNVADDNVNNGQFGAGVGKSHNEHREHHLKFSRFHSWAAGVAGVNKNHNIQMGASHKHMVAANLHDRASRGGGKGSNSIEAYRASEIAHQATQHVKSENAKQPTGEVSESVSFKKEDVVVPNIGPHAGERHQVTHVHADGRLNIRPLGVNNTYRLGEVTASPSHLEHADHGFVMESAPPGMEDWVLKNKSRFVKQYGKKKGPSVLYATAWKLHNKRLDESVRATVSAHEINETPHKNFQDAHERFLKKHEVKLNYPTMHSYDNKSKSYYLSSEGKGKDGDTMLYHSKLDAKGIIKHGREGFN